MKKLICLVAVLVLTFTTACKKEDNSKKTELSADMLMTIDQVKEIISYTPVMHLSKTDEKSTVRFDSDPKGEDPVIIELYSHNDEKSVAMVHEEFLNRKQMRPSSQELDGYDAEVFIAFPSIYIYRDGYMAVITAGSGGGEEQTDLLKSAGKIATLNLLEFLKINPTNTDLLKD